jgi:hypothetical protein
VIAFHGGLTAAYTDLVGKQKQLASGSSEQSHVSGARSSGLSDGDLRVKVSRVAPSRLSASSNHLPKARFLHANYIQNIGLMLSKMSHSFGTILSAKEMSFRGTLVIALRETFAVDWSVR